MYIFVVKMTITGVYLMRVKKSHFLSTEFSTVDNYIKFIVFNYDLNSGCHHFKMNLWAYHIVSHKIKGV